MRNLRYGLIALIRSIAQMLDALDTRSSVQRPGNAAAVL